MFSGQEVYKPQNNVRVVTATSLFDGHDVAINVMRRLIQWAGCEVIHLGHNRSAQEIVDCAIQEGVQSIAITSYQGGHIEYFKYIYDLLQKRDGSQIKIFGGGGGTILPKEIETLHNYGITRVYSPDDGRSMGLQGMINDLVKKSDFSIGESMNGQFSQVNTKNHSTISHLISSYENFPHSSTFPVNTGQDKSMETPVLGITGTGGAGKSSLVDEIILRMLSDFPDKMLAVFSVDPSKQKTGGALLGDRIRMNSISNERVYMRSFATRQVNQSISKYLKEALEVVKGAGFDLIILETSGIGQSGTEIVDYSDIALYVMTPEYGAPTQLEKINMLDYADIVVLNKSDKKGSLDALKEVKKQYQRNHQLWDTNEEDIPVFSTIASFFNDPGMNEFYFHLVALLNDNSGDRFKIKQGLTSQNHPIGEIIPPNRVRYLSEIAESIRNFNEKVEEQREIAQNLYCLEKASNILGDSSEGFRAIQREKEKLKSKIDPENLKIIEDWSAKKQSYREETFTYKVRGKDITVENFHQSLSHTKIPKITLPKYEGWGEILKWSLQEKYSR